MDEQARAALLISQSTAAMIEAMGMNARNQKDSFEGKTPTYSHVNFQMLIQDYGINHNAAVSLLQGR